MKQDAPKHAVSGGPKRAPTRDPPERGEDPDAAVGAAVAAAAAWAGYFTMRSSFLLLRASLIQTSASYRTWFVWGFGTLCRENLVTWNGAKMRV